MSAFFSWLDRRHFVSVRAGMQYAVAAMTWQVTVWAFEFARTSPLPGLEVAAVLAAVTVPFCGLQAAIFSQYMGAKKP
jgi:hypothetical protein